jgi:hypothetical protein
LAGYFDESDDNERAYSIGGFIGNQFDCLHLEWAWKDRLPDPYNLKCFKASELEAGYGEFRKFRDDPNNLDARFLPREKASTFRRRTLSASCEGHAKCRPALNSNA